MSVLTVIQLSFLISLFPCLPALGHRTVYLCRMRPGYPLDLTSPGLSTIPVLRIRGEQWVSVESLVMLRSVLKCGWAVNDGLVWSYFQAWNTGFTVWDLHQSGPNSSILASYIMEGTISTKNSRTSSATSVGQV